MEKSERRMIMGMCYSTCCKVICKNEEEVVRLAREYTLDAAGHARFSSSKFTDLDGMMKYFFTANVEREPDGTYTADFDASYGWENVMQEMFEAIAPALEDGSCLEVYPDNWKDTMVVKDGKVEFTQEEIEDDEEEDDDEEYCPSSTAGDYGPGNPWDAPGMSIRDFI